MSSFISTPPWFFKVSLVSFSYSRAAYSKILKVYVSSEDADMAIILLQKQIKGKKKEDVTKTSAKKTYFFNSGNWNHHNINKGWYTCRLRFFS